jgi:hypothetical protein
VGAIVQDRRTPYALLAIGGSSLLLGLIDRPTGDLDILAQFEQGAVHKLDELPEPLKAASQHVATALGLSEHWLDTGPSSRTVACPPAFALRSGLVSCPLLA